MPPFFYAFTANVKRGRLFVFQVGVSLQAQLQLV